MIHNVKFQLPINFRRSLLILGILALTLFITSVIKMHAQSRPRKLTLSARQKLLYQKANNQISQPPKNPDQLEKDLQILDDNTSSNLDTIQ